jgi:hypothetical protein
VHLFSFRLDWIRFLHPKPLDAETVMEGRRWGFGAWGLG